MKNIIIRSPTDRYALIERIYVGGRSSVYKSIDRESHLPVTIKVPLDSTPSDAVELLYCNDRDMSALLDSKYVQKCLDLVLLEGRPALVLEYCDGLPLKAQIPKEGFAPDRFLEHATVIATGMCDIHAAGLIHKDVNSRNILLGTQVVKFTNFCHATRNARELIQERGVGFPGALEYIAPEQTGRLNRWVTTRSDLYALGVTFYEMLYGHLPFRYTDPGELLYAHIALPPVFEPSPRLPEFLKQIALKLLAKDPDQRYKSAQGLLNDLKAAASAGREKNFDPGYPVGEHDPSTVLNIPDKLFGRDAEIRQIRDTFQRVHNSALEILIVKGYSGIGKTALLFELAPLAAASKGYMIAGKFDQFQRNIPYSALIEGFRKLMVQLLTEGEQAVQHWKRVFLAALGANARLIAEVIPELEAFTGLLPAVETLNATAARNRFVSVFKRYIRCFAAKDRPFVIFLDDLQWADLGTLQLIQDMLALVSSDLSYHILLVGSYRDNEVDAAHPLTLSLDYLKSNNLNIQEIKLAPLRPQHVSQLMAETLELPPEKIRALNELTYQKTSGNPFFINQFLHSLSDEGLLRYQHQSGWHWDIDKIKDKNYTDNVAEFVVGKIRRLDPQQQQILRAAACIGNVFDTRLVSEIAQLPIDDVQDDLALLVNEGLLSVSYHSGGILHHFLHDRIQDAALSALDPQALQQLQYRLGMAFAKRVTATDEDKIFDLVNCLNPAIDLLSEAECIQLAEWNYTAAVKAKRSNAYTAALEYLLVVHKLLPADKWNTHYRLTCDTCTLATECAYLTGAYDQMEAFAHETLTNARKVLEKTAVYEIVIQCYGARYKMGEALDTARKALSLLGIQLPHKPSQVQVLTQLAHTMVVVGRRNTAQLEQLPVMTDTRQLAAMRILISATSSAYLADPNLFPIIVFMLMRLVAQHGNSQYSSYVYVLYGMIFIGSLNQTDKGYGYVTLGVKQLEQFEHQDIISKTLFGLYGFCKHWKEPIHGYLDDFLKAYKYGLESGDIEYALWNLSKYLTYSYLSGVPIPQFTEKMNNFVQNTRNLKQVNILVDVWHTQLCVISGQDDGTNNPLAPNYADRFEQILQDRKYFTAIGEHYLSKSMLYFYDGQYSEALSWARRASRYEENMIGTYYMAILVHYHGLALVKTAIQTQQLHPYRKEIKKVLTQLKGWAKHSPASHGHRYEMVAGGYCEAKGDIASATQHYRRALDIAREHRFNNDEAIICQMTADCLRAAGMYDAANTYYQMAHRAFRNWGAVALADRLARNMRLSANTEMANAPAAFESGLSSEDVDLNTILKSSQAISGEIEQEQLFAKLIGILVQNAGAEHVQLLMERSGTLTLVANRSPRTDYQVEVRQQPLEQCTELPRTLIDVVYRTREAVVLHDARSDERFRYDPHIVRTQPRSVLCFPLIHKGQRAGIIYMENNLTTGVFTAERLKVLQLLSSQIVVSEENARLYQEMKALNASYERFVPKEFLDVLGKDSILQIVSGDSVEQDLTVMFTDIRNFTGISEQIAVGDTFRFLNEYLQTVGAQIGRHQGIVDKYLGDGILALFPRCADDALQASVDMRRLIQHANEHRACTSPVQLQAGFGIHSGRVMLGTLGFAERLSTTVVGDTVNMAARLEAATKTYGMHTLLSEDTVSQLHYPGRFHLRRIDTFQVKGKTQPVTIYEEFSHEDAAAIAAKTQSKTILYAGMDAFRAGNYAQAQRAFRECMDLYPTDTVAKMHFQRSHEARKKQTFQ